MATTNPFFTNKNSVKYDGTGNKSKTFEFKDLNKTAHSHGIFTRDELNDAIVTKFNRYGYVDPYHTETTVREYLFFTKPDLYIFSPGKTVSGAALNPSLVNIPLFYNMARRQKKVLAQLQYSVKDDDGTYSPFLAILSNRVTSKMDLPGISADSQESTGNMYGTAIAYRGSSYKSDIGFDFTLSFTDTDSLDIYNMVKAYDEYIRLNKAGLIEYINNDYYMEYIRARILFDQFSVYKFLVGSDGERILYYAKATGCFFTDVPRSDFGDPGNEGFKYSLSFHANMVEDNNPSILQEFNMITPVPTNNNVTMMDVFSDEDSIMNNEWAKYPCIRQVARNSTTRMNNSSVETDYRMKWVESTSAFTGNDNDNGGANDGGSFIGDAVNDGHVDTQGSTVDTPGKRGLNPTSTYSGTTPSKPRPTNTVVNPNNGRVAAVTTPDSNYISGEYTRIYADDNMRRTNVGYYVAAVM